MLRSVYQCWDKEQKTPAEVVQLWKLDKMEKVLHPSEIMFVVKLNWDQPSPYIIFEGAL